MCCSNLGLLRVQADQLHSPIDSMFVLEVHKLPKKETSSFVGRSLIANVFVVEGMAERLWRTCIRRCPTLSCGALS
jgi:hypothetical protein